MERRHKATATQDRRARLLSTTLSRLGRNPWDLAAMEVAATHPEGFLEATGGSRGDGDDSDDDGAPTSGGLPDILPGEGMPPPGGLPADVPAEGLAPGSGAGASAGAGGWDPAMADAAGNAADDGTAFVSANAAHVSTYEELCRLRIVRRRFLFRVGKAAGR